MWRRTTVTLNTRTGVGEQCWRIGGAFEQDHILGQTISVRDPSITQRIEDSGIDFVERHSSVSLSPAQLLTSYER